VKRVLRAAMIMVWMFAGRSATAAERVDYLRQVKPLLSARCYACHGALQTKGGLRADTAKSLAQGGDSGPAVVPGESGESLILERISGGGGGRMPPPSEGEGLGAKEIALLAEWINQGAVAPPDEKPEADPREHWAFRAPDRAPVPLSRNFSAGGRGTLQERPPLNPIDAFLAAEWEKRGLRPQPPASKRVLLRRVSLDLIGLPPSNEELAAFDADLAPDAYERVVERLLASKQYGERWGRHWMDIWRYSDWWGLGNELRYSQKHIWHWRDWIIESLNEDKGYDRMVREMLAADELFPTDLDRLRATGFLARPYFKFNRSTWLEDVVEHTGKAFLGLTLNCAKCHDHKYDPISQVDYYRFRSFFEPYQLRTDQLPGEADYEKNGLPRAFDCNLDATTYLFKRGDERQPVTSRPLTPGLPPLLALGELKIAPVLLPVEASRPELRPFVFEDQRRMAEARVAETRAALDLARTRLAQAVPDRAAPGALPGGGQAGVMCMRDDFATPKTSTWDIISGHWNYRNGKLVQGRGDETRSVIRVKSAPLADFEARVRFTLTGGGPWRSAGLGFDAAEGHDVFVYLSAYEGGPKLQVAYQNGGEYVYPPEGAQARPVRLGETYELSVRVRGRDVNVAVNGKDTLAYRLPVPRLAGGLFLLTYAAQAEFSAFELTALAVDAAAERLPILQAKSEAGLAEKALAAATAQRDALQARAAADRARHQLSPAVDVKDQAVRAAALERRAALAKAEEDLAKAELELLSAPAARQKAVSKSRDAALAAKVVAAKSLETLSDKYTPLAGAIKTLESNVETEASRARPFPTVSTGRRTALAGWLTDRRNPLAARVAVNHIWMRHFGRGLVPTVFDFGRKGAAPSHPGLLDWLAVDFMDSDWSMKRLHRLIVLSAAYRRSSSNIAADPATATADPENRWYWRMNPVRMEAQAVRDSILHLAGLLDLSMGGPPVPVADELSLRRSIYIVHAYNQHHKFLSAFDDANVLECYRRSESIVPAQALALSNSRFSLTMAAKISARLHDRLGPTSDARFISSAFEAILAVSPSPAERATCEQAIAELTRVLREQATADPGRRARDDLVLALLSHNDFITIR
jgi:mono/diheme cytochrome c family protein